MREAAFKIRLDLHRAALDVPSTIIFLRAKEKPNSTLNCGVRGRHPKRADSVENLSCRICVAGEMRCLAPPAVTALLCKQFAGTLVFERSVGVRPVQAQQLHDALLRAERLLFRQPCSRAINPAGELDLACRRA